jgi:hypothetical protein
MSQAERSNTYAAVDLGSNSFHLLVARREHGELRVIDRIKEKPACWIRKCRIAPSPAWPVSDNASGEYRPIISGRSERRRSGE